VGILRGSDPTAGSLILGAHYDHLGRGNSSSLAPDQIGQVHNGADDNASGTSALVELARVFSAEPRLRRTLVFAAFSGEELGILGSSYFVSHPPVPLDSVQVMINMDMVGRPHDNKITVGGVGSSPGFTDQVKRAGEAVGLGVSTSKSGYGASDHTVFYAKDVPVLFFFSGLHEDYHKPSDDWEKIDREGITEVARMVHIVTRDLAEREDRIAFVKVAEDSAGAQGHGAGGGYGAYLGTIPDFGDYEGGAKLSGVKAGSPADKAGIRGGDVIVNFGGREVKDLHGYTYALREHKPGDKVTIVLLRGTEKITVEATLGRRE
jgi:membrane-associated protease RseP (regulator of RpoE activity)